MLHKRIEEAALNAWPALQQLLFDGWIVRFSDGYTKRANSVTPLYKAQRDAEEHITCCEQFYHEKRLPCIFRLPAWASPDLDHLLARRHYSLVDPTQVMYLNLEQQVLDAQITAILQHESLEVWMRTYCRLSGTALKHQNTHKAILQAIPAKRMLVSLSNGGNGVACGMGVLEQRHFGLFDIVTAPQQRNNGFGTQLIMAMLRWAAEQGAAHAYLQVVETNAPARHLYAKLGFTELYRYWYRVAPG
jgi:GNAT superfamily N-acetyltransferase